MIDGFYTMLSKLAADPKNNFTVFDTRNILTRNAAQPNGWADEIHPYFTGFTVLANKFLTNLQAVPQFKSGFLTPCGSSGGGKLAAITDREVSHLNSLSSVNSMAALRRACGYGANLVKMLCGRPMG